MPNAPLRFMNPQSLMLTQLALEGVGFDTDGRLVRAACPQPDVLPRLYLARIRGEWLRYCRFDVPEIERVRLNSLLVSQISSEALARICDTDEREIWQGRSYVFPEHINPLSDCEIEERHEGFCVVEEGKVVSRAWSSREDDFAAELAVETDEAYRRQGYAKAVASAWAARIIGKGKVAFYSHRVDNWASGALARSLNAVHFMDVISCS